MSQAKLITTNRDSQLSDIPHLSSKLKGISWQQSAANMSHDQHNEPASSNSPDGGFESPEEDKTPKAPRLNMTIEERLMKLEKEMSRTSSSSRAARAELSSKLDFAHYIPTNQIVRISSEDWHEKKGGKFAVPEPSVLTVCRTSRHWRGRHAFAIKDEACKVGLSLSKTIAERPYRLAISGYELLRTLETIFGLPVPPNNNVWIWPFKHFIAYESQIRQRLIGQAAPQETEKKPRSIDNTKTHNRAAQGVHGPVSNQDGDSSINEGDGGELEEHEKYGATLRLQSQLKCLVEFMDTDMKELFSIKRQIDNSSLRSISFDYLWFLYKPGDLLITSSLEKRAYRVLHVTGGREILDTGDQPSNNKPIAQPTQSWERHDSQAAVIGHSKYTPFKIDTFYIDFDGYNFGPVPRRFMIQEYEGEKDITALPVFPADFDKSEKNDQGIKHTEEMLTKRGRQFIEMAGVAHMKYSGLSARDPSVADWQEEVNSDVVIDFVEAIKHWDDDDPGWDIGFNAGVVIQATRADSRETNEVKPCAIMGCTSCKHSNIFDDSYFDLKQRSTFLESTSLLRYRAYGKEYLDRDQIVLLPPRVYGYSLLDRYWYALNIDNISDINTSKYNGFDDLVLPRDHKQIMQALVKHHTKGPRPISEEKTTNAKFSVDLVRGKGKGLIILLHGVPGVGKTSTAECVAAQTNRPLFPLTCGDIGTTASEVEERLEKYFELAHKWGCVLLLDEADVYLASREKGGDLKRNSLISVFLRVLEYYPGILILTTNRVGEFDEAFKSRIHISLYYPKLDQKTSIKIWKMNVARIQRGGLDMDVEGDRIIEFAEKHWAANKKKPHRRWNGRQIKNAFQTAIALATWDYNDDTEGQSLQRPRLTDKHFKVVSETSAHFDDYLGKTHQIDEDETFSVLAQREGLRSDDMPSLDLGERRRTSLVSSKSRRRTTRSAANDSIEEEKDSEVSDDDNDEMQALERKLKKMQRRKAMSRDKKDDDSEDMEIEKPRRTSKGKKQRRNYSDESDSE